MKSEKIFQKVKKILEREGWSQQKKGEIYDNGTLIVNYQRDNEIFHIALNFSADEEILE